MKKDFINLKNKNLMQWYHGLFGKKKEKKHYLVKKNNKN